MNKLLLFLCLALFLGAGCVFPSSHMATTLRGEVVVGHFGGTEMGCSFGEEAALGDTLECNNGSVEVGILTETYGTVWVPSVHCDATEVFTKTSERFDVSYKTSHCDAGVVPGEVVEVTGSLEYQDGVWRNGVQENEWYLRDVQGW